MSVLTQLRTWGWLFNPITTYYCYDPTGSVVETTVVEVTNTPWHQRTAYVLKGTGTHRMDKGMRVAPFLPMDLAHRFTVGVPGDRLTLAVDDFRGERDGLRRFAGPDPAARRAPGAGQAAVAVPPNDDAGLVRDLPPGAGPSTQGRARPPAPGQGPGARRWCTDAEQER